MSLEQSTKPKYCFHLLETKAFYFFTDDIHYKSFFGNNTILRWLFPLSFGVVRGDASHAWNWMAWFCFLYSSMSDHPDRRAGWGHINSSIPCCAARWTLVSDHSQGTTEVWLSLQRLHLYFWSGRWSGLKVDWSVNGYQVNKPLIGPRIL